MKKTSEDTMTKTYQKKPIKVQAYQWEGQGSDEEAAIRRYRAAPRDLLAKCSYCHVKMQDHGRIEAAERSQTVCPGSYIITGIDGHTYACPKDEFVQLYDEVTTNGQETESA
jgi:hypothetical protein